MTTITSITWDLDPHTKAKHEILKYYLQAWFPILSKTSKKIIYLDGFAGPGIYKNEEEGSPIIAIKAAEGHILKNKLSIIIFWFIEKHPERAKILKRILKEKFPTLPENIQYYVEGAEFAPTLENVLKEMEEKGAKLAPTFAFLDPFGFSGLPMKLIGKLLAYEKCEVLITFMSNFVNRFSDELREEALDELFGTEKWKEVKEISDPNARKDFLLNLYVSQLKKLGGVRYVRTFEMIGKHNQTLYYLVYGTKHWKGLEVMKEAMYKVDRRGTYRFSDLTDVNQMYLTDYVKEEEWVEKASEMIFSKFRGKSVPVERIHQFVVTETPYIFRKKKILKKLEIDGKISDVLNRNKKFTYPKGCTIIFSN